MVDAAALNGEAANFSFLHWGSFKLPRVARSSLACEVQAGSTALEEMEFFQLVWHELSHGPFALSDRAQVLQRGPAAAIVTDCKSFFDAITGSESSALGLKDKRSAVECLAIRQAIQASCAKVRWVHSQAQLADGLTKVNFEAARLLAQMAVQGRWRLVHDPAFVSARRRAAKGLEILAG